MPGTKNSGRRKKQVEHSSGTCEESREELAPNIAINKGGRPRKSTKTIENDIEIPSEAVSGNVRPTSVLARVSNNVIQLKSRHSDVSDFYNTYLGPALECFPAKVLPRNRSVLQRYRSIRIGHHNSDQRTVCCTLSKEVIDLWDKSAIPHVDFEACVYKIKKITTRWTNAKRDERTSSLYQKELDNLLDLRPPSLSKLPALKAELQKRGESWELDYEFFKGQIVYPPTSFMSPRTDHLLAASTRRKEERNMKVSEQIFFSILKYRYQNPS